MKVSQQPRPKRRGFSFEDRVRCEMVDRGETRLESLSYKTTASPESFCCFLDYTLSCTVSRKDLD